MPREIWGRPKPQPPPADSIWNLGFFEFFAQYSSRQQLVLVACAIFFFLLNGAFFRLAYVLSREKPAKNEQRPKPSIENPTHLLIVLGSGGHTAEMLNILRNQMPLLQSQYTYRTYVVSSGDSFSALKAVEFEQEMLDALPKDEIANASNVYDIVTVRRARRVHQSLMTAPMSTLQCFSDSMKVLCGTHTDLKSKHGLYPDLILTNGPGTGVCVVLAAVVLLFFGYSGPATPVKKDGNKNAKVYKDGGKMHSIYIESWARVCTLSTSARILKALVDRFIVQWPRLAEGEGNRAEYLGPLVQ